MSIKQGVPRAAQSFCLRLTPEGQERAFERFANLNQTAVEKEENDTESLQISLHSNGDRP